MDELHNNMDDTLYQKLVNVEVLKSSLETNFDNFRKSLKEYKELPGFHDILMQHIFQVDLSQIDVSEVQRDLMRGYEKNPVLYDAIKGQQSIEDSLQELAQVNKGIRKILPRRKNRTHNERLEQLGQLISKPYHLSADGFFVSDNPITAGVVVTTTLFLIGYIGAKLIAPLIHRAYNLPEDLMAQDIKNVKIIVPAVLSVLGLLSSVSGTYAQRSAKLPTEEARYLDTKVQMFYK